MNRCDRYPVHNSMQGSTLRAIAVAVAGSTLWSGCYHGLSETAPNQGESSGETGVPGASDEADSGGTDDGGIPEQPVVPTAWERLSRTAYRNTLADLVTYASDEVTGAEVLAAMEPVLTLLPHDDPRSYASFDQGMSQTHVDAYFEVGVRLGAEMTASSARLEGFVGACATDDDGGNDATCLDEFVTRFGRLVHRAPLGPSEYEFYRHAAYAGGDTIAAESIADLVAVILSSPRFLYRVELGTEQFDGEATMALGEFELAARVSYLLWQSMPDPELMAAAEAGTLSTEAGLSEQVDRLFRDRRAQQALTTFFTRWLDLDERPNLVGALADPAFAALAGDQPPSATLGDDMARDVVDSAIYHVWTAGDDLRGWFASEYAFARSPELAAIYGVPPWDGVGAPPIASSARAGLLTRPVFLAASSMRTRPILRGALVRRKLLCSQLPPPPPEAEGSAGVPAPTAGAREWTETVTAPDTCAGCHALINPLGFALEGFDSLGRERSEELLFDDHGARVAALPIDTTASTQVGPVSGPISGPHDLAALMLDSNELSACLAKQYFRYAHGREIVPDTTDVETVEDLTAALAADDMMSFFVELALHPTFRVRGWEAP